MPGHPEVLLVNSSIATVGIDVSKDELVVFALGKRLGGFANTEAGLSKLREKLPAGAQVHLEASGGYDRLARALLGRWGFEVRLHNPRKVRRMADGIGFIAKNDQMDAEVLALIGPLICSKIAKNAQQERLCDISRTIKSLRDEASRHSTQMQAAGIPEQCRQAYRAVNTVIERQIQRLSKLFVKLVRESEFRERYELALSVPGIGPVTARVLACELPADLSGFSPKRLSSYAGLAPMEDQSGCKNRPRRIRKGNVHIKAAMFMPAVWAMSRLKWANELYTGLRAKGRLHGQAMVAVMRRLLVIATTVMRRGTPFQGAQPCRIVRFN